MYVGGEQRLKSDFHVPPYKVSQLNPNLPVFLVILFSGSYLYLLSAGTTDVLSRSACTYTDTGDLNSGPPLVCFTQHISSQLLPLKHTLAPCIYSHSLNNHFVYFPSYYYRPHIFTRCYPTGAWCPILQFFVWSIINVFPFSADHCHSMLACSGLSVS